MRTLASELGVHAARISGQPRVYVDANVPAGLVAFMRTGLQWDVLFVIEHADLRRLSDGEHYRLARQLRRTLITLDRDYLDDRRFPLAQSAGVIVLHAPEERGLVALARRLDREVFKPGIPVGAAGVVPATDGPAGGGNGGRGVTADAAAGSRQAAGGVPPLPLEGRKLHVHVDWPGLEPPAPAGS